VKVVNETRDDLGVSATCEVVGLSRSTYYRQRFGPKYGPRRRPVVPRKLPPEERQQVLDVLHEERFVDQAPAQVHAQLLDEGEYHCSLRTMHRILAENAESRERRNQLRHPEYAAPELLATGPNQVWSWDITKLLGPQKWTYFYLYVLIDIYSRYVVGWLLAEREWSGYAERLIKESCEREGILPGQLTIHSDRGQPMKGKVLAQLYADLGVTKTHSRPHTSNDNPFSEAHFKTLKYRPDFPKRFGGQEHARSHSRDFFEWYNHEHHHSALNYLTPHDVHHGLGDQRLAARAAVMADAYRRHPERFVHGQPRHQELQRAVWINPPTAHAAKKEARPEGLAPSVSLPTQRSGCSSAEPYPPSRPDNATSIGQAGNFVAAPTQATNAQPHPVAPNAENLGGLGAEPPAPQSMSAPPVVHLH
jgi:putative transposase